MSQDAHDGLDALFTERIDRRKLIRRAAVAGAGLTLAPWVATSRAFASSRTIKIGYVTPRTGPLAAFGAADSFVIDLRDALDDDRNTTMPDDFDELFARRGVYMESRETRRSRWTKSAGLFSTVLGHRTD